MNKAPSTARTVTRPMMIKAVCTHPCVLTNPRPCFSRSPMLGMFGEEFFTAWMVFRMLERCSGIQTRSAHHAPKLALTVCGNASALAASANCGDFTENRDLVEL